MIPFHSRTSCCYVNNWNYAYIPNWLFIWGILCLLHCATCTVHTITCLLPLSLFSIKHDVLISLHSLTNMTLAFVRVNLDLDLLACVLLHILIFQGPLGPQMSWHHTTYVRIWDCVDSVCAYWSIYCTYVLYVIYIANVCFFLKVIRIITVVHSIDQNTLCCEKFNIVIKLHDWCMPRQWTS